MDADNQPSPQAQVLFGSIATQTDDSGHFTIPGIKAGSYVVSASKENRGFTTRRLTTSPQSPNGVLRLPELNSSGIQSVFPYLNSTNVPLDSTVLIGWNDIPADLAPGDFVFTPAIGPFDLETFVGSANMEVSLRPRLQLPPNQLFTLDYSSDSGQLLRTQFRTAAADTSPPKLIQTAPADGTNGVPSNAAVRFTFNEPLNPDVPVTADVTLGRAVSVAVAGRTVTVTPLEPWGDQIAIFINLHGVTDLAGNETPANLAAVAFASSLEMAPVHNVMPEWNGALNAIVFASDRFGGYDIFSIAPDGTGLAQLTSQPGDELMPTVSADGQLLAWQADPDGDSHNHDIYVAPLSDADSAVAVTPADANDIMPRFSRTSSRSIVFVSDRLGYDQVFRMAADGSGYAALSPTFGSAQESPSPHPLVDNQVLFSSARAGSQDVWSMSISAIDGTVTALNQTDTLSFSEAEPDWGADASFFVFVSDEGGGGNLWLGDLTGGRRQVTNFDQPVADPSTSPVPGSMRCAASLARTDGGSDIVIIDLVSGLIVRNLTSPEAGN